MSPPRARRYLRLVNMGTKASSTRLSRTRCWPVVLRQRATSVLEMAARASL